MSKWTLKRSGSIYNCYQTNVLTLFIITMTVGILAGGVSMSEMLRFQHSIIDPAPPSGTGCCLDVCALGDIDGDGLNDIVLGSEHAEGLVWYQNPGWNRYLIGPGDFTTDGELADLNNDGKAEIIISCISRDQIEWWECDGDPRVTASWRCYSIGGGFAHDLAVGDINGDGRLDVVAFSKYVKPTHLVWYEAPKNPHDGWTRHEFDQPLGEGLALGDLDGDGRLDIAAGRYWYRNSDGHGQAWEKIEVVSDWTDDCRVAIADMNGNGKLDLVLSHSEGKGRLSWFENPTWKEHVIDSEPLEGAHSLEVADFDGDGWPDVMTGEMHTSATRRVLVYRNLSKGMKWERLVLATTGTHNARVAKLTPSSLPAIVGKNYEGPKQLEVWQPIVMSR